MRKTQRNLGNQLEEVLKILNKAQKETKRLEVEYPKVALRAANETMQKLSKEIKCYESKEGYDPITFADNIYKILVDTNYKELDNVKYDYDHWSDLDNKYNS